MSVFSLVKLKKEEAGSSVKYEGFRDDQKDGDSGRVDFGSTAETTAEGVGKKNLCISILYL